jgi:hypothetical protein
MSNVLATHGITLVFHASDEEHRQHLELLRSRLNGAGIAYTLRRSDGCDNGASFSQVALITPDGVTTLNDDSCVVERSQPLDDSSWYTLEVRSDNPAAPGLLRECSEAIYGTED